jgi:hypothetical protein
VTRTIPPTWQNLDERNSRVRYLLRDWIPYAMLTGLIGEPKVGKSAFVLWAIVRPIITGEPWFTGQGEAEAGDVVWLDTERRLAINLDRAKRWNLPVERIRTPFKNLYEPFCIDSPAHLDRLCNVICRYQTRAVILDSWRGSHTKDEDRSHAAVGLYQLASVCEKTGAACPVLHHAHKMEVGEDLTINAGRGTNAFLAAVACQLAIDIPDPRPNLRDAWRRLQVLGENLGIAPAPVGFRITPQGLEFGDCPARPARTVERQSGKVQAVHWLNSRLKVGESVPARQIEAEAEALGFSPTGTLEQAKKALGIGSEKAGKDWVWVRPAASVDGAAAPATPAESGGREVKILPSGGGMP